MWYYYLSYRIYRFYEKKGDSMPLLFSFFIVVFSVCINILSICGLLSFFSPLINYINKINALILIFVISGVNYFLIYRKNRVGEVYRKFSENERLYRKWDLSITFYFVFTILFFLSVMVASDIRNH